MSTPTVHMTQQQLHQLIESVRITATAAGATPLVQAKSKGSFCNCTTCFGGSRDRDILETFLTDLITYKELEGISDEAALRELPILFYGMAFTWWQGIRKEAKTWADAIALMREHFAPPDPAYLVYMHIFNSKQQEQLAIDRFICSKRALLAQLPEGRHDEETELDMIYGLLDIKYRKQIARCEVASFNNLLEKGRIVEENQLR